MTRFSQLIPVGGIIAALLTILLVGYTSFRGGYKQGFQDGRDAVQMNMMLREAAVTERELALGRTAQP